MNISLQEVEGVKISAIDIPPWVHLAQQEQIISRLGPNKEKNAVFTFSVEKSAPVNKEDHLKFVISTPSGETWRKEISVSVAPPDKFELFQNYPNTFNPTSKIEYILPKDSKVKLVIFDVLGQEVRTLVDGIENAGFKSVLFDASGLPSGVYFYRLQADNSIEVRSMLLMR